MAMELNLYLLVKNELQMASIFHSNLNEAYYEHVYPYMVPIMLPIAQIAMTASVYMTVVTCFDRYCYSKLIIFIISRHLGAEVFIDCIHFLTL